MHPKEDPPNMHLAKSLHYDNHNAHQVFDNITLGITNTIRSKTKSQFLTSQTGPTILSYGLRPSLLQQLPPRSLPHRTTNLHLPPLPPSPLRQAPPPRVGPHRVAAASLVRHGKPDPLADPPPLSTRPPPIQPKSPFTHNPISSPLFPSNNYVPDSPPPEHRRFQKLRRFSGQCGGDGVWVQSVKRLLAG